MFASDETSVKCAGACDALLFFAGMKHADGFAIAVPMKYEKMAKNKENVGNLIARISMSMCSTICCKCVAYGHGRFEDRVATLNLLLKKYTSSLLLLFVV